MEPIMQHVLVIMKETSAEIKTIQEEIKKFRAETKSEVKTPYNFDSGKDFNQAKLRSVTKKLKLKPK